MSFNPPSCVLLQQEVTSHITNCLFPYQPTPKVPTSTPVSNTLCNLSTPHRQLPLTSKTLQLQFQENPEDSEGEDIGIETNQFSQSVGENEEEVTMINTCTTVEAAPDKHHLQTSHAIAIGKVIGESDLLMRFDKLRSQMKKTNGSRSMHEEHKTILAQLQLKILQTRTSKLNQIKDIEQQYLTNKHALPTIDSPDEYRTLMHDYSFIQKLLRNMDIAL